MELYRELYSESLRDFESKLQRKFLPRNLIRCLFVWQSVIVKISLSRWQDLFSRWQDLFSLREFCKPISFSLREFCFSADLFLSLRKFCFSGDLFLSPRILFSWQSLARRTKSSRYACQYLPLKQHGIVMFSDEAQPTLINYRVVPNITPCWKQIPCKEHSILLLFSSFHSSSFLPRMISTISAFLLENNRE